MFSSVDVLGPSRECARQRVLIARESIGDGQHGQLDTQILCKLLGIAQAAFRGVRPRHRHALNVAGAQRVDRDYRHQRRNRSPRSARSPLCEIRICGRSRASRSPAPGKPPRISSSIAGRISPFPVALSKYTRSSSNDFASAATRPSGVKATLDPSKIKLSLPPT